MVDTEKGDLGWCLGTAEFSWLSGGCGCLTTSARSSCWVLSYIGILGLGFGVLGQGCPARPKCCSARANVDESEMSNQNSGVVSKETGVSLG